MQLTSFIRQPITEIMGKEYLIEIKVRDGEKAVITLTFIVAALMTAFTTLCFHDVISKIGNPNEMARDIFMLGIPLIIVALSVYFIVISLMENRQDRMMEIGNLTNWLIFIPLTSLPLCLFGLFSTYSDSSSIIRLTSCFAYIFFSITFSLSALYFVFMFGKKLGRVKSDRNLDDEDGI